MIGQINLGLKVMLKMDLDTEKEIMKVQKMV